MSLCFYYNRYNLLTMNLLKTSLITLSLLAATGANAENYPYRDDMLWVTTPDHADWLYETGENAVIDIQLYRYGMPVDTLTIDYAIGDDEMPADTSGTVFIENGKGVLDIGTLTEPGFRDLRLSAIIDGARTSHHVKVGFSPERLVPYTQQPDDFLEYWSDAVAKDKEFPLTYTSEPVEKYSTDKMSCSLVKLQLNPEGRAMYGYLFIPKGDGRYPAVLTPPGAGVKTIKEPMRHRYYGEGGAIRLEIEIHGLHPELSEEQFAAHRKEIGEYLMTGVEHPDSFYMKDVYLGCRRFLDLLTSLPQWDGKNLFTQGGSQGGALAITTAMLDSRVTGCAANHPALSDMSRYVSGQAGGYPHHIRKDPSLATPELLRTYQYYDVVNFARNLKCPVRMTWGYNDNTCPPSTSYIVYNIIPSPKECLLTPVNEHWTSEETERGHYRWIMENLKK